MLNELIELAKKSVVGNEKPDIDKLEQTYESYNDERILVLDDMLKVWRFLKSIKFIMKDCYTPLILCAVHLLALSPVAVPAFAINAIHNAWLNIRTL